MALIKASRANLSTSHYLTGGNNSLLAFFDSSSSRKQIFTERNKEERGKKDPYVGSHWFRQVLRASTTLQVYALTSAAS